MLFRSAGCEVHTVTECVAGQELTTTPTTIVNGACTPCEQGMTSSAGTGSCSACPAGYTNAAAGSATCTDCVAGSEAGATEGSCALCAAGKYSAGGACKVCSAGTFAATAGATACSSCSSLLCDGGEVAVGACPAGFAYSKCSATADVACTACPKGHFGADGLACTACTACAEGEASDCFADGASMQTSDGTCMVVAGAITLKHGFGVVSDKALSQQAVLAALAAENPGNQVTDVKVVAVSKVKVTATACPSATVGAAMAAQFASGLAVDGVTATHSCSDTARRRLSSARRRLAVDFTFDVTSSGENADISEQIAAAEVGPAFLAAVVASIADDPDVSAEDLAVLAGVTVDVTDVAVTSTVTYVVKVATPAAAKLLEAKLADTAGAEAMLTAVAEAAGVTVTGLTVDAVTSEDASGNLDWKTTGGSVDISGAASAAPAVLVALLAAVCSSL